MSYKATNKQTINNAFKTFTLRANGRMERGMKGLAEEALAYLVDAHDIYTSARDVGQQLHPGEFNTLAVAVGHDGRLVFSKPHDGGFGREGRAEEMAAEFAIRDSVGGKWVASIVSDMTGEYYADSKEIQFLTYSRTMVGNYAIHNFIRR